MPQPETTDVRTLPAAPRDGLITLAHVMYGLHAFAVLSGVLTSATVVGSFVSGLPSIVAVILNYLNRSEVQGTWLESHFRWQLRTFWFALLWIVVALVLAVTIIGIPFALVVLVGSGIWVIYRVLRGWLALKDRRPMPV